MSLREHCCASQAFLREDGPRILKSIPRELCGNAKYHCPSCQRAGKGYFSVIENPCVPCQVYEFSSESYVSGASSHFGFDVVGLASLSTESLQSGEALSFEFGHPCALRLRAQAHRHRQRGEHCDFHSPVPHVSQRSSENTSSSNFCGPVCTCKPGYSTCFVLVQVCCKTFLVSPTVNPTSVLSSTSVQRLSILCCARTTLALSMPFFPVLAPTHPWRSAKAFPVKPSATKLWTLCTFSLTVDCPLALFPETVLPSFTLSEQRNSEDVPFSLPGRACQNARRCHVRSNAPVQELELLSNTTPPCDGRCCNAVQAPLVHMTFPAPTMTFRFRRLSKFDHGAHSASLTTYIQNDMVKIGNKVVDMVPLLIFDKLQRSPDEDVCQQAFVGPSCVLAGTAVMLTSTGQKAWEPGRGCLTLGSERVQSARTHWLSVGKRRHPQKKCRVKHVGGVFLSSLDASTRSTAEISNRGWSLRRRKGLLSTPSHGCPSSQSFKPAFQSPFHPSNLFRVSRHVVCTQRPHFTRLSIWVPPLATTPDSHLFFPSLCFFRPLYTPPLRSGWIRGSLSPDAHFLVRWVRVHVYNNYSLRCGTGYTFSSSTRTRWPRSLQAPLVLSGTEEIRPDGG